MLMALLQDTFSNLTPAARAFSYQEMAVNVALATALGVVVALVYRYTHKGLSYSQSFTQTILYLTVIVAIVMMVIGSDVARAFALVGAMSIIRFRTVVKDTKDTSFVFAALAIGMAAGTGNYFLALLATASMVGIALWLYASNFGALYKSEFILRFTFDQSRDSAAYLEIIKNNAKRSSLLHIEPSGDGQTLKLTYDITLEKDSTAEKLTRDLGGVEGTSEVVLIVSKGDVDY